MRQSLNGVFNKHDLNKKRNTKLDVFDFSYLAIDPEAVELV